MCQFIKHLLWKRTGRVEAAAPVVTEGWGQLNLRRFFEIRNLPDSEDYDLQLTSILSGVPVSQLETMPLKQFKEIQARVAWIKSTPMPDVVERRRYVVEAPDGVRIFNVSLDLRKWVGGQYMDYQRLAARTETPEDMAALLCCFLIPAGHKYGDEEYDFDELRDWLLENFPALDAFALHSFFVVRSPGLMIDTETSSGLMLAAKMTSRKREMRRLLRAVRGLARSGAGKALSMPWPRSRGCLGNRHLVLELSKFSTR